MEDQDMADDDSEDPLAHLPDYVLLRVERLQGLNLAREKLVEEYLHERASLEKKFEGLMKPLYEERAVIVRGEKDEEISKETDVTPNDTNRVKGIPQFWACAMTHEETVSELITEEDVDCLEHLMDITCEDRNDGRGFTLYFHFSENEYFTNAVLTKQYEVPNLLLSDEPILKNVEGCEIDWKPGRSLTHRIVRKKQRGKGKKNAGQVRTVEKTEDQESFFHWFQPPKMPEMEEMDEEEAERLEELFDNDYDVAQAFRNNLIPKAVLWFTGQVKLLGLN